MRIIQLFSGNKPRRWEPTKKRLLKSFSIMDVSSRDILMLLYYLYKKYGMYHITYRYECSRCCLYYISEDVPSHIRYFFDDRSSYDIEALAIECGKKYQPDTIETVPSVEYANGFISPEVFKWREISNTTTTDKISE